jgi:hypothetical protein
MLKKGDTVRVRFDLSKHSGVTGWVEKMRVNDVHISETFPIGYATGTVIGKSFCNFSARERQPIAVVKFGKGQVICGVFDVSSSEMAISIARGPDWYGARIVDNNNAAYMES